MYLYSYLKRVEVSLQNSKNWAFGVSFKDLLFVSVSHTKLHLHVSKLGFSGASSCRVVVGEHSSVTLQLTCL